MKHDLSSYFCRGPDDFCWGPALVGPTLVTGLLSRTCALRRIELTFELATPGPQGRLR